MIIPLGDLLYGQQLYLVSKENGKLFEKALLYVRFVPMVNNNKKIY
jgi:protein-L-isoaspartate O-methyltransferase